MKSGKTLKRRHWKRYTAESRNGQYDALLCAPRRGGASLEQICGLGLMGMWYSHEYPRNHHDLHFLAGWTYMHILDRLQGPLPLAVARATPSPPTKSFPTKSP